MKNVLIIGYGEVGKAIYKAEKDVDNKIKIIDKISTIPESQFTANDNVDVMHMCIPYSNDFVSQTTIYAKEYHPKLIIINSTVKVGTTQKLRDAILEEHSQYIVHSFLRGIHPHLHEGLMTFVKYVGGDKHSTDVVIKHFKSLNIKAKALGSFETTELAKIISTSYYGWNILFAKECQILCNYHGVDFDKVYTEPNKTYNDGYTKLGMKHVVRPVLYPPKDEGLSGHCISSNAMLLHRDTNSIIGELILSMGYDTDKKFRDETYLYSEYMIKRMSTEEIGRNCDVSGTTIRNYIRAFDIPIRPIYWTKEENDLLLELSQEMTFKEISDNKLINKTYEAIRIQASKLKIKSPYDPSIQDEETRKKISCTLQNIDIEDFKGYTTELNASIRNSLKYREWRTKVFERDNWICQNKNCNFCSNKQGGVFLNAHHIKSFSKYPELRFEVDNGITYCQDFHMNGKLHNEK